MKNKTHSPEDFHPVLKTLLNDGLLLPTQAQTIHNLSNSSKKDVEYLLLALGLASERTLQSYLQQEFGVTSLINPFLFPNAEALNKISKTEAAKSKLIPQLIDGNSISVLALPPINQKSIERLSKKTSLMLVPIIITTLRFNYLLEICYGMKMDPEEKYVAEIVLETRQSNFSFYGKDLPTYDPYSGVSSTESDPLQISELPVDDKSVTIFDDYKHDPQFLIEDEMVSFAAETSLSLHNTGSGIKSHSLDSYNRLDPDNISSLLSTVQSRDELPQIFYSFGSLSMRTATILTVADDFAMGWTGTGLGLLPEHIEGIILPLDKGSFIKDIIDNNIFYGKVKDGTINRRLLNLMGGDSEDQILGSVVKIKDRPVIISIFVIDDDSEIKRESKILEDLSNAMSSCIIRLIRERKSK